MRAALDIARRAAAELRRRPSRVTLTIGAMAAGLLLVATVRLAGHNLERATADWQTGVQMIVYLEDGTGEYRARQIQDALEGLPAVATTEYVPPDAALGRLRESLGEHDALARDVEPDLLPASIEVSLAAGVKDVAQAHPVIERLENVRGVQEVEFPGQWVDRMTSLVGALDYAVWFVTILVGLVCATIASSALRLALPGRRREIETLELLGASPRYVRAPMLVEGALQGAAGAGLAIGLLWLLYRFTAGAASRALSDSFGSASLAFLSATDLMLVICVGAIFGLAGSFAATGRRALARA